MAGKAFEPTDEQKKLVETLSGYGVPQNSIAALVINPDTGRGIDKHTLEKHFRDELNAGMGKAHAAVGKAIFRQAAGSPAEYDAAGKMIRAEQKPVPAMSAFYAKTQMRWRETAEVELVPPAQPIKHEHEHTTKPSDAAKSEFTEAELRGLGVDALHRLLRSEIAESTKH